jgi:hypothetical protein
MTLVVLEVWVFRHLLQERQHFGQGVAEAVGLAALGATVAEEEALLAQ